MPNPTPTDVAAKLRAERFEHAGPAVQVLTDPIVDTPMVVTLEQLRPYDLNPRKTRNPHYDDIKASIRERKLDAPPPITRRPGEPHYIIRNGGNTRLEILNELWAETKDEAFFRICCLFRPWSADGEIIALTGHLAENELRGNLTFVERALAVEKARELYEKETGNPLTQTELARRLTAHGYPIVQSRISRMQDAIRYLLPAIPLVLFGGLGKAPVERLMTMRNSALRAWQRRASRIAHTTDFDMLYQDVLAQFNTDLGTFNVQRVQDELVGQMAGLLSERYDLLMLEIVGDETLQRTSTHEVIQSPEPVGSSSLPEEIIHKSNGPSSAELHPAHQAPAQRQATKETLSTPTLPPPDSRPPDPQLALRAPSSREQVENNAQASDGPLDERVQAHIVSPVATTDRLEAIQRTIAQVTGDALPDFRDNVVRAIPVKAGGLYPISDVWYIEPALDAPDTLRMHIAQLALEIAAEGDVARRIESVNDGIGFVCASSARSVEPVPAFPRALLTLLSALSSGYLQTPRATMDGVRLIDDLGPLLQGRTPARRTAQGVERLSDAGLVKLFRLIRLTRRLLELESSDEKLTDTSADTKSSG